MTPISLKSQVLPATSKALQDPLPSPPSPRLLQSPPSSCSCSHTSLPPSPPNTPGMPCPRAFSPVILAPGTCFPQRPTWFPASLSLGFYSKSATSARPSTTFPCFSFGLCSQTNICYIFLLHLIHCLSSLLDCKLCASKDFCLVYSLLCPQHPRKHVISSRCSINTCARKKGWVGPVFCTSPPTPSHAKSLWAH